MLTVLPSSDHRYVITVIKGTGTSGGLEITFLHLFGLQFTLDLSTSSSISNLF